MMSNHKNHRMVPTSSPLALLSGVSIPSKAQSTEVAESAIKSAEPESAVYVLVSVLYPRNKGDLIRVFDRASTSPAPAGFGLIYGSVLRSAPKKEATMEP